jgi:hypothetical protein
MQRIMETLLERRGLAVWVEDRLLRLLKNGATVYAARGYADYVYGHEPSYMSREGYELAAHELGDLTMG